VGEEEVKMVFGLILIAVGVIAILEKAGVITGSVWDYTWPAILVILGLSFILGRFRRRRWFWGPWSPPWEERGKNKDE
jgi:hypothetical protein